MDDYQLMARVFDGGEGDHPELLDALRAYSRETYAEFLKREHDGEPYLRKNIDGFVSERIRVARVIYGN